MLESGKIQKWIIYKIANPEGRVYIGRTSSLAARIKNHFGKSQHNNQLKDSIQKYGRENHAIEVIEEMYSTREFADGKEIFWIRTFLSNQPAHGFNVTIGGHGTLGWKQSAETINRRVAKLRGKKVSDAQKLAISKKLTGVKLSSERAKNIGTGHQKKIYIFDLNNALVKQCESGKEAYFFLYGKAGSCGHINEVAKGRRVSYKGFIFKYNNNV